MILPVGDDVPVWLRPLAKVNVFFSRVAMQFAGALLAAMVLMILAQVFYRYVLNDSLPWTEEMAKFSMVWIAFLVAPWVYREHLNVAIEMFADAFPVRLRQISEILISLLVILISALFFRESLVFWQGGWSIQAASVPLSLAWFYSCAPFSFLMLCSIGVEKLLYQCLDLFSPTAEQN